MPSALLELPDGVAGNVVLELSPIPPQAQVEGAIGWEANAVDLERCWREHARMAMWTGNLHRFWAKTEMRQRIWGATRVDGQPLAYTGTVRDLLLPALAAFAGLAVVLLTYLVMKWLAIPRPRLQLSPWRLLFTLPMIYVLGLGLWRRRWFLVVHTAWRGRDGTLIGDRFRFAFLHFAYALATPLTLGWIVPWRQVAMQRRLIEGMTLGGRSFTFAGNASALLPRFAGVWLLGIVIYLATVVLVSIAMGPKIVAAKAAGSLSAFALEPREIGAGLLIAAGAMVAFGLLAAWYRIGVWRLYAAATRLDGRQLRLAAPTVPYMTLVASNMGLMILSLGALASLAELRHARFIVQHLTCEPERAVPGGFSTHG